MARRSLKRSKVDAEPAGDAPVGGRAGAQHNRRRGGASTGVATHAPIVGPVTHYHARRFEDHGDLVLAVTRILDPVSMTPERLELRAFRADSPGRGDLALAGADRLLAAEGGLAWVGIDLQCELASFPWDAPAQRIARIDAVRLRGETASERAVHVVTGLVDWLRTTWEHELTFGTWYAIRGDGRAFDAHGSLLQADDPERTLRTGDFGTWAARWLAEREHAVTTELPGSFFKVLNAPLLARIETGQVG